MSRLVTLNGINNEEVLNSLFSQEISIIADIQGSKIWVNWNGKEFTIKTKSISSEPINLIDLAMQNYYNPAINYLKKKNTLYLTDKSSPKEILTTLNMSKKAFKKAIGFLYKRKVIILLDDRIELLKKKALS